MIIWSNIMNYKAIKHLLILILCVAIAIPFSACETAEREVVFRVNGDYIQWRYTDTDAWNDLFSISELNESGELSGKSAYDIAVSQGFEGSEEEWIESLRGVAGDNGADGSTPYIGENGNWWIGDTDTGVSSIAQNGLSIYAVPSFIGKTPTEIQEMTEAKSFLITYYGEIDGNTVASQSIEAGVIALKGTQIKLYMKGYVPDATVQLPTEAPTQAPTEAPTQAPTQGPTQAPTEAPTQAPTEAPTQAPTEAPTQAPTEAPTSEPTEAPTEAPTEYDPEIPSEILIINMTSPVPQGQMASVTVHGKPNTEHTITVMYSSGPSKAEGLEPATSNVSGVVSWSWRIGASTKVGTYQITVSDGERSVITYIEIVEAEKEA